MARTLVILEDLLRGALGAEPREIPQEEKPASAPAPAGGVSADQEFQDFLARFHAEGASAL